MWMCYLQIVIYLFNLFIYLFDLMEGFVISKMPLPVHRFSGDVVLLSICLLHFTYNL